MWERIIFSLFLMRILFQRLRIQSWLRVVSFSSFWLCALWIFIFWILSYQKAKKKTFLKQKRINILEKGRSFSRLEPRIPKKDENKLKKIRVCQDLNGDLKEDLSKQEKSEFVKIWIQKNSKKDHKGSKWNIKMTSAHLNVSGYLPNPRN